MADIDITRSHSLGRDDGRAAVGRVADKLETELGVDAEWTGDTLQFSGQGADGHIEVEADAVHVAINLSAFLQPMRSRVQAEAEDYLDQSLQSQA
ncbi:MULTISPECIES: polyhydroxyalkanoic acid system family protein [Salinibacter]|jgi:putative polyhydroxyalkanoic acid system protein|uniref:polyhydroxyalkanoic acid system family protein n=1 Tax=Salinibacter TaxID=146918 RepID=UPI001ABB4D9E|nr:MULTISPECIES: polyhydroxyalkanoic acid system family protein [Salinibacter]